MIYMTGDTHGQLDIFECQTNYKRKGKQSIDCFAPLNIAIYFELNRPIFLFPLI